MGKSEGATHDSKGGYPSAVVYWRAVETVGGKARGSLVGGEVAGGSFGMWRWLVWVGGLSVFLGRENQERKVVDDGGVGAWGCEAGGGGDVDKDRGD